MIAVLGRPSLSVRGDKKSPGLLLFSIGYGEAGLQEIY